MELVQTLAIALTGTTLAILLLAAWIRRLRARLRLERSRGASLATRHGQTVEQFAPFLPGWPGDPKRFRFIGNPVDGIQFNDDGVVFVEVKTGQARLSETQLQVKAHVAAGRVTWREVRIP